MKQLCTNCLLIGYGRHGLFSGNIYIGIVQMALGVALIAVNIDTLDIAEYSLSQLLILGVSLLSIIVGALNILDSRKPGRTCPKCRRQAMIVIDSPEGQQFIEINNISIPEEALKD